MKDFDVWVARNHLMCNRIYVYDVSTAEMEQVNGCCFFNGRNPQGIILEGEEISKTLSLERYGFLPRPGELWNVWTEKGVLWIQRYPMLLRRMRTKNRYSKKPYRKVEIKTEKKYYR